MDKMRQKHVEEMDRLREAIYKTNSIYLKSDYSKKLRSMQKELRMYDRFKRGQ